MNKAIEILTESIKNYQMAVESKFSSSKVKQIAAKRLKQHNEALAELTAHKAKIGSLKEWVIANYNHFDRIIDSTDINIDFEYGAKTMCKDILAKLEELEK